MSLSACSISLFQTGSRVVLLTVKSVVFFIPSPAQCSIFLKFKDHRCICLVKLVFDLGPLCLRNAFIFITQKLFNFCTFIISKNLLSGQLPEPFIHLLFFCFFLMHNVPLKLNISIPANKALTNIISSEKNE
jgi:hypothetical protein